MYLFLISSPLHYLYSLATIQKMNLNESLILWFGNKPITNYELGNFAPEVRLIDLHEYKLLNWSSYKKKYSELSKIIQNIDNVDFLFTCYDSTFEFEIIKNKFSIDWDNIGLIEDGIANYYKVSMPSSYFRKLSKSILNFFQNGFFFNMSRYNLGGNPKISAIATIDPKLIYLHKKSKSDVIDIYDDFKLILDNINLKIPELYFRSEVIFFLVPIFSLNRMNEDELTAYLKYILSINEISKYDKILLKPHPREDLKRLDYLIKSRFSDKIVLAGIEPIEIYLKYINFDVILGLPSTAMINYYILNKNKSTKFILTPVHWKHNRGPFSEKINIFKKRFVFNI